MREIRGEIEGSGVGPAVRVLAGRLLCSVAGIFFGLAVARIPPTEWGG